MENLLKSIGVLLFAILYFLWRLVEWSRVPMSLDEEMVIAKANMLEVSEFKVFEYAGVKWGVMDVRRDFVAYIVCGEIPHYVRDYVRG
jgi:formate hydrogenlyase subunit 4